MTYGEDPDTYRRPIAEPEPNLAAWITGGVLALAVIFSVFLMFRGNDATTTASNVSNRPQVGTPSATPPPSPSTGSSTGSSTTTGSGATSPAPAGR